MKFLKVFVLIAFALSALTVQANHILGGNITYECLGGDLYGVTLTLYKDCFGSTAATDTENLFFIPGGCGALPFSANIPLTSESEISDLCDSELLNSSCNGGFIPGAQLLTYYGEVNLSDACVWNIQWASGDWNYFINMDNGMLPESFLSTTLDPTIAGCNSSITLNHPNPVNYSCTGDNVVYDFAIDNPNGYDLQFGLTCPLTTGGANAPLITPCNEPIAGLTLNPVTGQIEFTAPMLFGNYVVAVQIDMFDNGDFIGTIIESVAFTVRLCVVTPTSFEAPLIQNLQGGTLASANEINACVGDSVCFNVQGSNTNIFRTVTMTTDFETVFPGETFSTNGNNPVTGNFCLLATDALVGANIITIDIIDDACIAPDSEQEQITINISPGAFFSVSDTTICFGEPLNITVVGDTQFQWNVLAGDPDLGIVGNGASQTLNPSEDTQIEVVSVNGLPGCQLADTLDIFVSLSALDFDVIDESCAGNDGAITLTVTGGTGNYSYDWPDIPSNDQNPSALSGGDYEVTVNDLGLPAGCTRTETVTVDSTPAPEGSISGTTTICEGDCADITFALSGTGPFTVALRNETTGLLEATGPLGDGDAFEVCPSETTTYTLELVTDANTPACTYDVISEVTVTVRPALEAGFAQPNDLCAGEDGSLEITINQLGTYDLTYTPNSGLPGSPLAASDGDAISLSQPVSATFEVTSVQYTDAPFCPGTALAPIELVVHPLPTVSVDDALAVCANESVELTLELTGTGPWLVEHDYGPEPSPLVIAQSPFVWTLTDTPAQDVTITLTHVIDQGVDCSADVNEAAEITVNGLPSGSVSTVDALCFGEGANLEFALMGNGPFIIEWSDGTTTTAENDVLDGFLTFIEPTSTTTYCLETVQDANGCSIDVNDCTEVSVVEEATAQFGLLSVDLCAGECVDLPLEFTGGVGPYSTLINLIDGAEENVQLTADDGDTVEICPNNNGTVAFIEVVDEGTGCSVNSFDAPIFEFNVSPISTLSVSGTFDLCEGECAEVLFNFTDATGPFAFTFGGEVYNVDASELVGDTYTLELCPGQTTTYTLTAYTDTGNECSAIDEDEAVVNVYQVPTASFIGDLSICEGNDAVLEFFIDAAGPVNLEIEETIDGNSTVLTVNGAANGDAFITTPSQDAVYTMVSVLDPGSPAGCNAALNEVAEVTVNTAPLVSQIDTLCALNAATYQLSFVISGGDPNTYSVNTPGSFETLGGGPDVLFTSDPLVPLDGFAFVVSDQFDCAPVTIVIDPFECPSNTFAGTVDLTPLVICNEGVISTTHNGDEILDADDVLSFIIHSSPDASLGIVYYISDQPEWDVNTLDFNGVLSFGETYYLSAVAGDDDGSGVVNLGALGINVSEGMPFTVLETPTASLSGNAVICEGESTELQIDFTGSGPYTINIELDGFPALGSPINGITENPLVIDVNTAGTYALISVANDVCPGNADGVAEVVVNPLPTAQLTGGGLLCEGETAALDLAFTGTPDYTVTIANDTDGDGTADVLETITFANADEVYEVTEQGDWFIVTVVDATGCANDSQGDAVTVEVVALPTAVFVTEDTSFCAGESVEVTIELGGEAPWSIDYGVAGVPVNANTADDLLTFTTSDEGSVCISVVTDANGCQIAPGNCIELTEIPLPIADAGANQTLCATNSVVLGTPAVPGTTYTWSPSDQLDDDEAAEPQFTAPPGEDAIDYVLELIAVANGCSASDEVTVTVNPLPVANAGADGFICEGDDYQLNATGGTTYLWNDNGAFVDPVDVANPFVQPTETTVFLVTVTDQNGCSAAAEVTVTVADPISAVVDASELVCFETCDGSIEVTPEGGFGEYTITWSSGLENGNQQEGLCAGDYTFTIDDTEGCSFSEVVTIDALPQYVIEAVVAEPTPCAGSEAGQIVVTSPEAVTFTLNPDGITNATGVFDGLPAGFYTIMATDDFGCTAEEEAEIIELSLPITLEVDFEAIEVCLGDEVTFNASAGGGDGNFSYTWYNNPSPSGVLSEENPYVTTVFTPTTVYVQAIDGNGCPSEILSTEAFFGPPIAVDFAEIPPLEICLEQCVDLQLTVGGGNGNYTYSWTSSQSGQTVISTNAALTDCPEVAEITFYNVIVDDGCNAPASIGTLVDVLEIPEPLFAIDVTEGCFPVFVEFENLTDTLFTGSCVWDFGDGNTVALCDSFSYVYNTPGTFIPSLSVTAPNGCEVTAFFDGTVDVFDYPVADFTWDPNPINTLETTARFVNQSSEDAILFEWNFAGLGNSTDFEPVFSFPSVDASSWLTCLRVENIHGCADSICFFVDMASEVLVYVPTAFTPDNDGLNELFRPVIGGGVSGVNYEFSIWDRWGERIFFTTDPKEGWNGSVNRGNYYAQIDAYVWVLKFTELDSGNAVERKGHVTLIR